MYIDGRRVTPPIGLAVPLSADHTEFDKAIDRGQYEPPAIADLGSLMQVTAGTGNLRARDAGGASV